MNIMIRRVITYIDKNSRQLLGGRRFLPDRGHLPRISKSGEADSKLRAFMTFVQAMSDDPNRSILDPDVMDRDFVARFAPDLDLSEYPSQAARRIEFAETVLNALCLYNPKQL